MTTPWTSTTHPTSVYDLKAVKIVPTQDYERARLCFNALLGISDEAILCFRPGELKQLLAKRKPEPPSLFDKGEVVVSAHKLAASCFCQLWEELYKAKYPFAGGKDGTALKGILRHINNDDHLFERIVRRYLADREEWIIKNRHSLAVLSGHLHRWLVDPVETVAAEPQSKIAQQMRKLREKQGEAG